MKSAAGFGIWAVLVGLGVILQMGGECRAGEEYGKRIAFPSATPESVGLNSKALDLLATAVQRYVDTGETVGAELAIIKDRKLVFHRAFGLRDQTDKTALEPGAIYCIRSMSKTFVGGAVQMLLDEGKLKLDDTAAKYLPAFDRPDKKMITIGQLLAHRSGLPLSSLLEHSLTTIKSVQDVAALAAEEKLEFEPGAGFNYSDDGTDTLTAIVEKVTGGPAETFITERILKPLGLRDTFCVPKSDDPRMPRVVSTHIGGKGAWLRYWKPGETPIFPCFLGSQSMYSTVEDYGAYLLFWLDGKAADGRRLLSPEALERARRAQSAFEYPTHFPDLAVGYGQLMMVYAAKIELKADPQKARPVIFGHGGSDGTMAWLWPERGLLALYFTQSRGGLTGITIEGELERFVIKGETAEAATTKPELASVLGFYRKADGDSYHVLFESEGKLHLEAPGRFELALKPSSQPSEWQAEIDPAGRLVVERDAAGRGIAITLKGPDGEARRMERFDPPAGLPSVEEVTSKVIAAHNIGKIKGVVRRSGALDLGPRGRGKYTSFISADRTRADIEAGGQMTRVVSDGKTVKLRRGETPVMELQGALGEQTLMEQPQFVFGDWRGLSAEIRVVARVTLNERPALLVRATAHAASAVTFYVDEQTGRVVRMDRVALLTGLGQIGVSTRYEDFVEVGGATLPRHVVSEYATAILGTTAIQFDEPTVLPTADAALFSMDAPH